MRYRTVLFDVGDTLIGPRGSFGAIYQRVMGELGLELPAESYNGPMREVMQQMNAAIPTGVDRYSHFPGGELDYWLRFSTQVLERATGKAVEQKLAEGALQKLRVAFVQPWAWQVFPDVVPALQSLREMGVQLGVVSNWDSRLQRILAMLGLEEYFEQLGVSHLERVEKPDPRLFRIVMERLKAGPEEALHIGDLPELDGAGARAAGIDFLLIDRHGN